MAKSDWKLLIVCLTFVAFVAIALGQGSTLPLLIDAIVHALPTVIP